MKVFLKFTLSLISMTTFVISCNKEFAETPSSGEIILMVDDGHLDVSTRATALTAVPSSLYWSATTGTLGSETKKWDSTSASVASGKIATGKYQTATATTYNYYLANTAITFASTGSTIVAENTNDIIVGKATSNSTAPSITMDHVFARTGSVSCSSANGYVLSNLSYKIKSKDANTGTKGTYNIKDNTWSSATALSEQALTNSSDLYLIPGVYTFTVSGTEKMGDYSKSFSASADITLAAGKVNNISAKRTSSGAQGITISVTLNPWGTNNLTPSI